MRRAVGTATEMLSRKRSPADCASWQPHGALSLRAARLLESREGSLKESIVTRGSREAWRRLDDRFLRHGLVQLDPLRGASDRCIHRERRGVRVRDG